MSAFAKMTAKLDEGWKMTTMNCDCKSSLLINMENKDLYCWKCDKISHDQIQIDEEDDTLKLDEEIRGYFARQSESDGAAKELGKLLLQGWTMLEESCDQCNNPFMQNKQGIQLCVKCGNKAAPGPVEKTKVNSEIKSIPIEETAIVKRPQQYKKEKTEDDIASEEMGKLLVSGWGMLEETCLTCMYPIMRKDKTKTCVKCKKYITEPSPVQNSQQQQFQQQKSQPTQSNTMNPQIQQNNIKDQEQQVQTKSTTAQQSFESIYHKISTNIISQINKLLTSDNVEYVKEYFNILEDISQHIKLDYFDMQQTIGFIEQLILRTIEMNNVTKTKIFLNLLFQAQNLVKQ